jgi:hypothetical protein
VSYDLASDIIEPIPISKDFADLLRRYDELIAAYSRLVNEMTGIRDLPPPRS